MSRYTGKNGTAGVGDMNPGGDVYVKSIGEFWYGSRIVKIGMVDPRMGFRGETFLHTDREHRLVTDKARRLAKATLTGAKRAIVRNAYREVRGSANGVHGVVEILVTRNAR